MLKEKLIIFTAGIWAEFAYDYYKENYQIESFVDNNRMLAGSEKCGLSISGPEILAEWDGYVAIADGQYEKEIRDQLSREYGIDKILSFQDELKSIREEMKTAEEAMEDPVIVKLMGGIGNQLFQYALYRCLESRRIKVAMDTESYINADPAIHTGRRLDHVFKAMHFDECSPIISKRYREQGRIFVESASAQGDYYAAKEILTLQNGYVYGFFQLHQFADEVMDQLREEFLDSASENSELQTMAAQLKKKNCVSVHIRRGDYLDAVNAKLFGGICTEEYYKKAIQTIQTMDPQTTPVFFSNDLQYVRTVFSYPNALYISKEMFDKYEDWYDMFLMSSCRYHIIANSSFSWWGAQMDDHPEKIVIAPGKWINHRDCPDVFPKEWIKI